MVNNDNIANWVRRFLIEYLIDDRNLSHNTQASYRDTFVLLFPFAAKAKRKAMGKLGINDLDCNVVRRFLGHIESDRGCGTATRNQRLAAIRALAHFIGQCSPEHMAWSVEICSIPFKKTLSEPVGYLEKEEMDALLNTPKCKTVQGKRDYTLLLFMYNTGARVNEVASLTIGDLNLEGLSSVRILGKGNKIRYCPLWALTSQKLRSLTEGRGPKEPVFLNQRKEPITRFGIHSLLKRCVSKAGQKVPSLITKRVSGRTIRHTAATHLLRSGVEINTIRAWLGHVSLDTTNIYTEVDLEMKAKALDHCQIMTKSEDKRWQGRPKLMDFLKSL